VLQAEDDKKWLCALLMALHPRRLASLRRGAAWGESQHHNFWGYK